MGGGDGDGDSNKACALGGQFGSLSRKIKQVDTYAAVREQTTVPRCIQIVTSLRPWPLPYIRPQPARLQQHTRRRPRRQRQRRRPNEQWRAPGEGNATVG